MAFKREGCYITSCQGWCAGEIGNINVMTKEQREEMK